MTTSERIESPLRSSAQAPRARTASTDPPPVATVSPARLRLRELSGWEEEYLERHQAEPNTARLCNEILARCLVPPGADPGDGRQTVRDLLVVERDRELVELRRMSLGPRITARVDCPACGQLNEAEFSLDVLPLDFEAPPRRLTVPLADVGDAQLRLPTAGDQEDLIDANLDGDAERRSWLLARCLTLYGDRDGPFDVDFTRGLPVRARAALESAIDTSLPTLDLEMALVCSHCQAEFTAPYDVPVFFFRIDSTCPGSAAGRPPACIGLPLGTGRHSRADAGSPAGLPHAAGGGGRRRPARRPRRGRVDVSPAHVPPGR